MHVEHTTYDPSSAESIFEYARQLEGTTLRDACEIDDGRSPRSARGASEMRSRPITSITASTTIRTLILQKPELGLSRRRYVKRRTASSRQKNDWSSAKSTI